MHIFIKNACLITPIRKISGCVSIRDGIIEEVIESEGTAPGKADIVIDAKGFFLSPGFIELHTHGGGGHDFMDGTVTAVEEGCRTHLAHGTTAILPTTLSSSDEELFENFVSIREAAKNRGNMPEILGIHLEGPYFSPNQNAAQDKRYIKTPVPEEYKMIYKRCPSIKIWSVAPELPGALEMGRWMKDNGIIGSIGHSDAVYAEVLAAVENGYTMITHFFNGMSRLVRKNAKMYLGVAESGLCFDDLTAEIIADGCHLPPELLRLIYKIKGPDRICLVTDSMRAAGQKVTESILGSKKNGQKVEIEGNPEQGVAYMPGRASFGGSIATANRLVYTMIHLADVPIAEAVKMMTLTPARLLDLDNRIGSIAAGKDADIIVFDEYVKMKLIMIKGKIWLNTL